MKTTVTIPIHAQGIEFEMVAHPEIWRCGDIQDGVLLGFVDDVVLGAPWTISFSDLEKLYLAAKAERETVASQS